LNSKANRIKQNLKRLSQKELKEIWIFYIRITSSGVFGSIAFKGESRKQIVQSHISYLISHISLKLKANCAISHLTSHISYLPKAKSKLCNLTSHISYLSPHQLSVVGYQLSGWRNLKSGKLKVKSRKQIVQSHISHLTSHISYFIPHTSYLSKAKST